MFFIVTQTSCAFSDSLSRLLLSLSLSEHLNCTWPRGHFQFCMKSLTMEICQRTMGSSLGVKGSNFTWHKPLLMETGIGGSQEPPFSLLKCNSSLQPFPHEEWPLLMKNLLCLFEAHCKAIISTATCHIAFYLSLPCFSSSLTLLLLFSAGISQIKH